MSNKARNDLVIFGLAALVSVFDQATKEWVRQTFRLYQSYMPIRWLEPYVTFTYVRNPGAAFGLGQDLGVVLILTALLAIGLIVFYFRRLAVEAVLLRIALGLQLGGAIGNLADRVRLGAVTDFVNLGWFPVFNVADAGITIGSILLAYYAIFVDRPPRQVAEMPVEAEEQMDGPVQTTDC